MSDEQPDLGPSAPAGGESLDEQQSGGDASEPTAESTGSTPPTENTEPSTDTAPQPTAPESSSPSTPPSPSPESGSSISPEKPSDDAELASPASATDGDGSTTDSPLYAQTVTDTGTDPTQSAASSSSSSESFGTPSTQVSSSVGSAAESEPIVETVPATPANPTPQVVYGNTTHLLRWANVAFQLSEVGWVGPEAITILPGDLRPLYDLIGAALADRGL